jgi:oligoribonuclease NrnB/cAMP/cGMP phosphodiesterase (DHH superfamily)
MFKTIIEIFNYILDLKNKNTILSEVNSASKTSLWRQFLEVVSTAYWAFVNVRDLHDKETDFLIQEQKVPNQRWYRNKALSFQYGFGGHKNAAGLSLVASNLEEFKTIINKELENSKEDIHIKYLNLIYNINI